jgi:heptosyltransferase-1
MPDPRRILIIRPSALGDVCRSVPVLASLRRAFPYADIDWLVQDSFADAIRSHPSLSGVVAFDRKGLGSAASRGKLASLLGFLGTLRARRYDLVIDVQGLARSGVFAWATRAGRRIADRNSRELGWLGATETYRIPPGLHSVDRMLRLLELAKIPPLLDLRLTTPPDAAPAVEQAGLAGKRYCLIAPTSRWPAKAWPADRFASVATLLLRAGFERVIVVGGRGEREQCAPILELAAKEPRIIDAVGATTVGELMALVEMSSLVIANDSAALHMAVGYFRPLIALYGPTRVELVGPYGRTADVIQHVTADDDLDHKNPANVRLMERITVDEVLERA